MHPVDPTENQIERAAWIWNEHARGTMGATWHELQEWERVFWREAARQALVAALSVPVIDDSDAR